MKFKVHYIQKDLVEPVLVKRKGEPNKYRVNIYGHIYEWYAEGLGENRSFEQVLTRDGQEICRTPGWDSGPPCIFAKNFNEIAGTRERSMTVVASLMGAIWPDYHNPREIEE